MLGIVLVNYKSFHETVKYVQQELSKINVPYKLVIINNASTSEFSEKLANSLQAEMLKIEESPQDLSLNTFVISVPENLGFACGNNLGADFLLLHFNVQWLLITNNDLIIKDGDIAEVLVSKMKNDPAIGMIGPKITDCNNKDQSPHRYQSIWSKSIIRLFYPIFAPILHMGKLHEVIQNAKEGYYYRIMGSFFILRVESYREVGGFDPATFLYVEEQILSERLSFANYKVYFLPTRTVIHNHGQTTSLYFDQHRKSQITLESLVYYYKTYRNATKFACWMLIFSERFYYVFYNPLLQFIRYLINKKIEDRASRKR